jgi:hypothetical protein
MTFIRSFARHTVALCLLTAFNSQAQTTASAAHNWQPCPDVLAESDAAAPDKDKQWDFTLAPYAHHWNYNPEHRPVFLGAVNRHVNGNRFCGLALFRNSFGQPSAYIYVGKQWNQLLGNPQLFAKVSAGLLYGYKDKYQNKIPFNDYGIAPAIIPSLGYSFTRDDSMQVMVLGTAGLLFSYGHSF